MIKFSWKNVAIFGIVLLLVALAFGVTMLLGFAVGQQSKSSTRETLVAERTTAEVLAGTATTTGGKLAAVETAEAALAETATTIARELSTVAPAATSIAKGSWLAEYWQ